MIEERVVIIKLTYRLRDNKRIEELSYFFARAVLIMVATPMVLDPLFLAHKLNTRRLVTTAAIRALSILNK